ncbi:MAG: NAD-dependent epimerase/dehydratase family protein, partial [Bacteroidota bacterium]
FCFSTDIHRFKCLWEFGHASSKKSICHILDVNVTSQRGKDTLQIGNLTPLRSYIHVKDVADAFFAAGMSEFQKAFETVNIGTETENSVQDIIDLIAEISNKKLQTYQDPAKIRKVDRPRQLASLEKTKRLTGWYPKRTLKEALEDAFIEIVNG